jgi:uncharacterized protein involved in type VI secretion and phage assembly
VSEIPQPGVAIGVVVTHADPRSLGRVQVHFSTLSGGVETMWARVMTPMTGPGRGRQILPAEGDTVVLAFEDGDVSRPLVLGGL